MVEPLAGHGEVSPSRENERPAPTRVALLFESFPSVTEPYLLSVAERLADRGMLKAAFSVKPATLPRDRRLDVSSRLRDRIHYLPTQQMAHVAMGRFSRDLLRGLFSNPRGLGALFRATRRARGSFRAALRSFATLLPMAPFLRGVIHIEASWLAQRFPEILDIPGLEVVVSFRGHDMAVRPRYDPEWVCCLQEKIFPKASRLHFVSQFLCRTAEVLGVPPEKCVVPSQSIADAFFDVERSPGEDVPLLVCVGRLVWIKGFQYAIEAAHSLKGRNVRFRLVIIGDGADRAFLDLLIAHRRLEREVELLGAVPSDEVRANLSKAAVFICPSVSPSESLGRQLMEAQAVGVPIVATNVGGITECVEDGVTAFCVPPFEAEAIAEKLVYLLEHPDVASRMGEAGRKRARLRFRVDAELAAWEIIYAEMLRR
ncbi:MAG: glycosyltransferase family 4 protein [Candidatus Coatesbacteria bacterium]|nr:glycosyltransferase family 4 protein [Candidatus Coatesbacteria bacterium]